MKMWIKDIPERAGEVVDVYGWVHVRRDHGKLIFVDLRDRSGLLQVVFSPKAGDELYEKAKTLRPEWVVHITGLVKERPEHLINEGVVTGTVELEAQQLEVLSEAHTPPIDVESDGKDIGEEVRMKYRYIDLRRERMKDNLVLRHAVIKKVRDALSKESFLEIETPVLTKSTPEGARDYIVPSRTQPGSFYALPQSPQQYKQLLMVGGLERYFQFAKCFRDEDTRGDRQPEFTQMDLEMSFASQEDIMTLNEQLLIEVVTSCAPDKKIQQIPFPRMTYQEAMDQYGTDRPDLREDKDDPHLLAFVWITDFPFFEKTDHGTWTFTHNPFSAAQDRKEYLENDLSDEDITSVKAAQYDIVLNGWEIGGGSIREHTSDGVTKTFSIMGYAQEEIEEKFGHFLEAFNYGVPPHGGIAWGLDRLIMILANEPNIREVMAFPKTGDGRDLMMHAPSPVSQEQLDELGIQINSNKEEK
jgi:aspartyl-tRNA synthetase